MRILKMIGYLILFVIVFIVSIWVVAFYNVIDRSNEPLERVSNSPKKECLIEKVPFGSSYSFGESKPGQHDYTIYATTEGYEVWGKCK